MPLAAKGALALLYPFIASDPEFDLEDFYPGLVEVCKYQGKLYSLPRYTSVYVLFYNKDLFDAAGVTYPDESWTWQTYLNACRKIAALERPQGSPYGCIVDFWGARIYPWVWSNGGDVLDDTHKRCVIDSPQSQEALQFLVDLRYKHKVAPPLTRAQRREANGMFQNGRVAIYMTGAWDIQDFLNIPTLHWDVAPLPKQLTRATLMGTENYAIAAATKHPKEAWELFKFLHSAHAQTIMGAKLHKQPSRMSVANGPFLSQKVAYNRRVFVDALSYAKQAPNIPEWDRVSHFLQDQLDLIWAGKVSVAEGTKTAARQVTEALAEGP